MTDNSEAQWFKDYFNAQVERHGDFPPPYVFAPDEHPMSMFWRMGGGETHLMVFFEWFESNFEDQESKIQYLLNWPTPPCWYSWIAETIWQIDDEIFETIEKGEDYDYSPYLQKLADLGFKNTENFESDFSQM